MYKRSLYILVLAFLQARIARSSFPICYDYKVSNRTLCPMRNNEGGFSSGYLPVCYHTIMWKEYSPPPTCREIGCNDDATSACCCGADPTLAISALDPNKVYDKPSCNATLAALAALGNDAARSAALATGCAKCGPALWGTYAQTGGAAGMCGTCHRSLGGSDGNGGKVLEEYGSGVPLDASDFGHVSSADYKLLACPTATKLLFEQLEAQVNRDCDVNTYLATRRCGNCWRSICAFHNQLHWQSGFPCAQDLFIRRMACYADWYHKYCDCKVTIPSNDKGGDGWLVTCKEATFFFMDPRTGIYPVCSSDAVRPAPRQALRAAAALLLGAALLLLPRR